MTARREADGSIVVSGRFPIHDLVDLGIAMPEGEYTTVAGLVLDALGRIARRGDQVVVDEWEITVLSLRGRTVGWVRFRSSVPGPPKSGDDRPRPPAA